MKDLMSLPQLLTALKLKAQKSDTMEGDFWLSR
jgi:hypothetical protein